MPLLDIAAVYVYLCSSFKREVDEKSSACQQGTYMQLYLSIAVATNLYCTPVIPLQLLLSQNLLSIPPATNKSHHLLPQQSAGKAQCRRTGTRFGSSRLLRIESSTLSSASRASTELSAASTAQSTRSSMAEIRTSRLRREKLRRIRIREAERTDFSGILSAS